MSCETFQSSIDRLAMHGIGDDERASLLAHVKECADCRMAMQGAEALAVIASRPAPAPRDGLFDDIVAAAVDSAEPQRSQFWRGAGFGALAASILAAALLFAWPDNPETTSALPEFVVSLDEARPMNLAFETGRPLAGATITIMVSGDVEIDGYGAQRELSWSEDLDAGVNRLSLPLIANGFGGGQVVVRLSHPDSTQLFVVNLPLESANGA